MTQDELKLVLEFVKSINLGSRSASVEQQRQVITAIEKALAQPEQEPVAWLSIDSIGERYLCFDKPLDNDPVKPLYTTPPQRTEQNFCPRCGKRTKDIHTCTPPKEGT